MAFIPWSVAWWRAAYSPGGFYLSQEPSSHFRTSTHVDASVAAALVGLLADVDARLGSPERLTVVDVGAGSGELATAIVDEISGREELRGRVDVVAVDVRARPADLNPSVDWIQGLAPEVLPSEIVGLVVAHEWLDDVPLDVVVTDDSGIPRLLLVEPETGAEEFGPSLLDVDACADLGVDALACQEWIGRWWPRLAPGERIEVGGPRDEAWAGLITHMSAGTAVAVDYAHSLSDRADGTIGGGTLTGYLKGHHDLPVPDGSSNITAHVALDACANAAAAVAGEALIRSSLRSQADVLGRAASASTGTDDPRELLNRIGAASQLAELTEPGGLGDFVWLVQDIAAAP